MKTYYFATRFIVAAILIMHGTAGQLLSAVVSEGIDIFPMIVTIVDEKRNPIENASIQIASLSEEALESVVDPKIRVRLKRAFRVTKTDEYGFGLAFFLAYWTLEISGEGKRYHRDTQLRIEVAAEGYKTTTIEWTDGGEVHRDIPKLAPIVEIVLKKSS